MRLVGQLSNPSALLTAVFDALPDGPMPTEQPMPEEVVSGRLGNGVVQRAVVKVLTEACEPMRGADIHLAVERLLEHPVSKHSVSWCLATGARGNRQWFERVAYGCYRLRHTE